ncbi:MULTISPECIES: heme acquisition protein HasA [Yersinia]|uniref:Hemophore HasA n=1 Tax=Yersinia intermedia TaxID=631 RepID=A0A0H5MEI7_YERIN|nr:MULTISPECIES: heme acquisition protein HasA [Yersinia]MCB5310195.1 heme acquisition protein HasA [Yersinia massiliensis]CRY55471.1 hemophore HasA [Yersinia intermedia]
MTITIKYDSEFADYSISTYTHEWAEKHGDITEAARGSRKYGEFEGGTGFSGTKYSLPSSHVADTAMIVEGDVTYSFMPQHTFYGKMDSLELGEGLTSNPNGKYLSEVQLKLSGLDISGEYDDNKSKEENQQGEMHKSVYGLMRGNAEPMLEILKAKGIDVDAKLKDIDIASQFDVMSDAPEIATVGIADDSDALLIAA